MVAGRAGNALCHIFQAQRRAKRTLWAFDPLVRALQKTVFIVKKKVESDLGTIVTRTTLVACDAISGARIVGASDANESGVTLVSGSCQTCFRKKFQQNKGIISTCAYLIAVFLATAPLLLQ